MDLKIVRVTVSSGRTINTGNYESLRPTVELTADFTDAPLTSRAELVKARAALHSECESQILAMIANMRLKKQQVEDVVEAADEIVDTDDAREKRRARRRLADVMLDHDEDQTLPPF